MDLRKIVDRKAGIQEMQEALALKADSRDSSSRQEIQEFLSRVESMQQEFEGKLDSRGKFKDILSNMFRL